LASPHRGSARRAKELEYKQKHKPRFRLYRAAKTQGRRREKGEDCPSETSSADPDGDRSDKPKGPITAAALSLTGKESPLYYPHYPASRAEKNSPIPKTQAYKKGVEK